MTRRELFSALAAPVWTATHPLYTLYEHMRRRCRCASRAQYANYGGRGITVCPRWMEPQGQGFRNFVADMGPRPDGRYPNGHPLYTLDRINNDGDYEPGNCRWATRKEQRANQRPGGDKTPRNAGADHGASKLDELDIVYVLSCLSRNVTHKDIASRIGITESSIWAIRSGRAWTCVTGLPRRRRGTNV